MAKKTGAKPKKAHPKGPAPGRFAKGNQASKGHGRPKVDVVLKTLRSVNRATVERLINDFLSMPLDELTLVANDPRTLALEAMIAKVCVLGVAGGDQTRLNYLLDRLIGKVPDAPKDIRLLLEHMPPSELLPRGRAAIAFLEAATREESAEE